MKILALEPWYGGSHRAFLDGLVAHSNHEFKCITMADRFWKWRMQGGAVTLAKKTLQLLEEGYQPDLIFATDMVNLPAYLALIRPKLGEVPVVLYFHENQLTYPIPENQKRDFTYGYINYLSCLAADFIVFNSEFHLNQMMEAIPELLRMFPDYTHLQTAQEIKAKSSVLHLGMRLSAHDKFAGDYKLYQWNSSSASESPIILWNQRWEYDKNPDGFFKMMNRLDDVGLKFRLILAGEHFNEKPAAFETAWKRYADRILHYGYAENFEEYSRLLHRADIVVSTAIHEFFGIAVMEAIYNGCHPVLPNRLTYPELIPNELHSPLLHAPVLYNDDDDLFYILSSILKGEERPLPAETLKHIPAYLNWHKQINQFDAFFDAVCERRGR